MRVPASHRPAQLQGKQGQRTRWCTPGPQRCAAHPDAPLIPLSASYCALPATLHSSALEARSCPVLCEVSSSVPGRPEASVEAGFDEKRHLEAKPEERTRSDPE